jgi:hypothetical protein
VIDLSPHGDLFYFLRAIVIVVTWLAIIEVLAR